MKASNASPATWMSVIAQDIPGKSSKKSGIKESTRTTVRTTSPRLRKRLVKAIGTLEVSIFYFQLDRSVASLLKEYRDSKSSGVLSPRYLIRMNRKYPGLVEHIAEVAAATHELDNYDPRDDFTRGIISLSSSYAKKNHLGAERARAKQILIDKKYLAAPRGNEKTKGTKGWIRNFVRSAPSSEVSDGTFDAIVRELKRDSGIG